MCQAPYYAAYMDNLILQQDNKIDLNSNFTDNRTESYKK